MILPFKKNYFNFKTATAKLDVDGGGGGGREWRQQRTARKSLILYTRGPVLFIDGHNPYCVGACVSVSLRAGVKVIRYTCMYMYMCVYIYMHTTMMMMMILLYTLLLETDIIYKNGWSSSSSSSNSSGGEIVYVNVVGKSPYYYIYTMVSVETGIKLNEQYRRSGGGGGGFVRRQKR